MTTDSPLGLYVHWPFCARICPYCDFNVYRNRGVDQAQWITAFSTEIAHWAGRIEKRPLTSLYFGGGTPSLMQADLISNVINVADNIFGFTDNPEITLEANPNDATQEKLRAISKAGVNRLSLGVQSFDDDALSFLGRDHNAADARRAITTAQNIFAATTFDLIYARPDQSDADWRRELGEALSLSPSHLSLYQLTIEPGTAFETAVAAKRWTPASDERTAAQFDIAQEMTEVAGLPAYEISNHAAPGRQSQHNLIYWRYQDYIGVGPGAHGRLTSGGDRIATKNHDQPKTYLEAVGKHANGACETETLSDEAQMIERLSMGLRLHEGIDLFADDHLYSDDRRAEKLNQLIKEGWLNLSCGRLHANKDGRRMLNRLLYELLG